VHPGVRYPTHARRDAEEAALVPSVGGRVVAMHKCGWTCASFGPLGGIETRYETRQEHGPLRR